MFGQPGLETDGCPERNRMLPDDSTVGSGHWGARGTDQQSRSPMTLEL